MIRLVAIALVAAVLASGPAAAVNPSEELADPALEARARDLSQELRCLVCQNQSIDESDADLAKDLRILVRERITAGDTDDEVLAYLTARYGDFVRLRPPFTAATVALWGSPVLVIFTALVGAFVYVRGRRKATSDSAPLTAEEQQALDAILSAREER